ncbi:hypothetical protein QVD17_34781 [Tagetes erecta]|uniref:Uncharacterized protein n=1 Tax=Tagetes erecta TaxID=13708 RepID=A0AAD8NM18_TARER|nr:hypothetical protein QVD17_34781 [Tagetes erecta]
MLGPRSVHRSTHGLGHGSRCGLEHRLMHRVLVRVKVDNITMPTSDNDKVNDQGAMTPTGNDNMNHDETSTTSENNENNPGAEISFTLIITADNAEQPEGSVPSSGISKGGGGKTH